METINYWAVLICAVVSVIVSTVWYSFFAKEMAKLHKAYANTKQPPPWQILLELTRTGILATIIAILFVYIGVQDWIAAIEFALLIWIGFPVVLLTGSVLWEKVPVKLAVLHAGDWLLKLLIIAIILGIFQ